MYNKIFKFIKIYLYKMNNINRVKESINKRSRIINRIIIKLDIYGIEQIRYIINEK